VALEFPLADIRNVTRRGRLVRFEIPSAAGSPHVAGLPKASQPFVTLWTGDEAAAAELAGSLGDLQTEAFAGALREHREFEQRLHGATPRAFMTPVLVGINVLVFAAMALGGAGIVLPEGEVVVRWGSNYGVLTASGEWWRLFTSMFLHFGIIHLAFNMAALWDIGRVVERLFGNRTFLAMYLLAGLSGSTSSLLWHPAVNSAGASGAIFGVFGMLAGYLLHRDLGVPATIMKKHWGITLPFIGYNLFIGATVPGIDNAAHLGGLAAGFAMGYALARPLDPARRSFSHRRLAALVAGMIAGIALIVRPLDAVSDNARTEREAREAMASSVREDRLATDAMKQAVERLRSREIEPDEAARRVRQEGVRRYDEANKRLSAIRLREDSRQRDRQEALIRYTALRREGYEMLAQSLGANDEALANKALARIGESNEVARQLEARRAR
jgi:rhomboid protease GluP